MAALVGGSQQPGTSTQLVVTLVGGGNSTHCLAPLLAAAGFPVNILTRRPEAWNKDEITVVNEDLKWIRATKISCKPNLITSDPSECIPQSDIIWFAGVPIHHNPALLQKIKAHLNPNRHVFIGTICCYGGFEWVVRRELGPGNYSCFGTQLIPWCCGTVEYGNTGVIFGAKRMLRVVTSCGYDRLGLKSILAPILRQDLRDTHFLASTLWPNNSSLHPPILYGLFKDWDGVTGYEAGSLPIRIYAEMSESSAKCVCQMDEELCAIVAALRLVYPNDVHLQSSFSMKDCVIENYTDQVKDKSTTATCVSTNTAFGKHNIPYTTLSNGKIVPTLKHKFFETDLPFGLVTFKDIATMCEVKTPLIDAMILWNQKLIDKNYLNDDFSAGKDIEEAIVPSRMGYTLGEGPTSILS